jgi:hypothetical protein
MDMRILLENWLIFECDNNVDRQGLTLATNIRFIIHLNQAHIMSLFFIIILISLIVVVSLPCLIKSDNCNTFSILSLVNCVAPYRRRTTTTNIWLI